MGEMYMSDGKGNEVTFERDGTVSAGVNALCDRCDNYAPTINGQELTDNTGQVIMWFCMKCRLQVHTK